MAVHRIRNGRNHPSVPRQLSSFFGEEVRALAGLTGDPRADRVIEAFAAVPRERHVPPGPWTIRSPMFDLASSRTPDAYPGHLYHDVLIALDEKAGINIGQPSLWARLFTFVEVKPGSRILQVGAGSGYYSAILGHIVGESGSVLGFEVDASLAELAQKSTSTIQNIEVRSGDAVTALTASDGPFDLVIAFCGVTHPSNSWLDALSATGRLLLPATGSKGWGAMCLFEQSGEAFKVTTLGSCGFYPCINARSDEMAAALDGIWRDRSRLKNWTMAMLRTADGVEYGLPPHPPVVAT
jgi:protein-L-isoaspartate(D-aspartate) O-methyltransferase